MALSPRTAFTPGAGKVVEHSEQVGRKPLSIGKLESQIQGRWQLGIKEIL